MLIKLKILIARILCTNVVGRIIASIYKDNLPSLVIKDLRIDSSSSQIAPSTKAQIFFGIYESAEYRFCNKYIPLGENIVELGSSIGLISSYLSKSKSPKNIIALEANPELIPVIASNFKLNGVENYKIINKAIGLSPSKSLWFTRGSDNTTGIISNVYSEEAVKVECTTLSDLTSQENLDSYVLICDIEGGEVDILLDQGKGLDLCKLIIIEIHRTERAERVYSIEEIADDFVTRGFELLERYGNTFVFAK